MLLRDSLAPYAIEAPAHLSVRQYKKPVGRCYELAGKFALDNPGATVVHGVVNGWMAHAWAEIEGMVYDGTAGGFFEMDNYLMVLEAVPVRRFERGEYLNWASAVQKWQPCDELHDYLLEISKER